MLPFISLSILLVREFVVVVVVAVNGECFLFLNINLVDFGFNWYFARSGRFFG